MVIYSWRAIASQLYVSDEAAHLHRTLTCYCSPGKIRQLVWLCVLSWNRRELRLHISEQGEYYRQFYPNTHTLKYSIYYFQAVVPYITHILSMENINKRRRQHKGAGRCSSKTQLFLYYQQGLHPFILIKVSIFSWQAIASQLICVWLSRILTWNAGSLSLVRIKNHQLA